MGLGSSGKALRFSTILVPSSERHRSGKQDRTANCQMQVSYCPSYLHIAVPTGLLLARHDIKAGTIERT